MDSAYLFDMYLENVQRYKKNQVVFSPARDSRPSPLLVDILSKERVGVAPPQAAENLLRRAVAAAA
jgi:carbamoyl-phosphate synthase small subunit